MRGATARASSRSSLNRNCEIVKVAQSLREQRVSPVALATACLTSIERFDREINAFITVAADRAIEDARTAESEIAQRNWRGPLHGVPVAIKDFYDTAGMRTTAAFEGFKDRIPGADAAAVARLKDAGAIIVGKTNMHRLGMGTTGLESAFGPVKNPWNGDFIAGGSSSGSAATVASGMCFATLDTDAIGSCRLPAACCGVVGFKGSYGLIDMSGILAGEQPPPEEIRWLSHAGIAARKVGDVAVVLDALTKRANTTGSASFADSLKQNSELRVGVASNLNADREVLHAFEQAVETIRGLGHPIEATDAPFTDFSKGVAGIEAARARAAERYFGKIDLLLLPTTPTPVPSIKEAEGNPLALSAEHTMFANYFGLPAISIPCSVDKRGLPLGLQIIGRSSEDLSVLRLASAYENVSFPKGVRSASCDVSAA